jgi:single-strand DNA-binding protein
MADFNKVFLIGRLTRDPELRYTPNGAPVTELPLATKRVYTTKDGERKEEPVYIDITVWNRQAETSCQYLKKGSSVHVEGFLKLDSWEDKNTGEKRSKLKVEAERVQFLDSRRDTAQGGRDGDDYGAADNAPRRAPEARPSSGPPRSYTNNGGASPARRPAPPSQAPDDNEEDIPF